MGYVYARGNRLWLGYWDAAKKLQQVPTGLPLHREAEAHEALGKIMARVKAGESYDEADLGPVTVRRYAARWIKGRSLQGLSCARDDEMRLRLHALPMIGDLKIEEVKPRHIRDAIKHLRASTTLAPRSIRHVYGVLHCLFRDAVVDELIGTNPCVLKRTDLPKIVDKNPTWRATAVFTRGELEQLISDDRLPDDRRMMYALMGLAGLRFGEAAALRWRSYDPTLEPLGRLLVATSYNTDQKLEKSVKTEQPRLVPVHPVLAKILAAWKLRGWTLMMGRQPTVDDLIIPSRRGLNRTHGHGLKKFHQDLDRLGTRHRRQHDLRRTFISLVRADGARKDILETVTHGSRGDIVDAYTTLPWASVCEEVAKLRIALVDRKVIQLRDSAVVDTY